MVTISPASMLHEIPPFLAFPLNNLYTKLKKATSAVEATERICESNWLYGCKQKEHMLVMIIRTPRSIPIEDALGKSDILIF